MVLTKETYLLHFIAALLALAALWVFGRMQHKRRAVVPRRRRPADLFSGRGTPPEAAPASPTPRRLDGGDVARVWAVGLGSIVAFYSSFGCYPGGVRGLLDTFVYMQAKGTASEAGHAKEFFYWMKLLGYYEWPALAGLLIAPFVAVPRSLLAGFTLVVTGVTMLCIDIISITSIATTLRPVDNLPPNLGLTNLGSIGALAAYSGVGFFLAAPARDRRIQWFALYGLASFTAYALIAYKTPWCAVNFLWPLCFVAGYALDRLCEVGSNLLVALVTVMLCAASVEDSHRLNFVNPVSDALPSTREDKPEVERYAYVQTIFDINRLLVPIRALLEQNPRHREMSGVVFGEAFPLIWELNDFPNVRFEEAAVELPSYDSDFLIVPDARRDAIEPQLVGIYFREPFLLRGGGEPAWLYLQAERFRSVLPAERIPEVKPRVPMFR
jgi:hypothetical protein